MGTTGPPCKRRRWSLAQPAPLGHRRGRHACLSLLPTPLTTCPPATIPTSCCAPVPAAWCARSPPCCPTSTFASSAPWPASASELASANKACATTCGPGTACTKAGPRGKRPVPSEHRRRCAVLLASEQFAALHVPDSCMCRQCKGQLQPPSRPCRPFLRLLLLPNSTPP